MTEFDDRHCGMVVYAVGSFTEPLGEGWTLAQQSGQRSEQQLLSIACDDWNQLEERTQAALTVVAGALGRPLSKSGTPSPEDTAADAVDRLELVWHWRPAEGQPAAGSTAEEWHQHQQCLADLTNRFLVEASPYDPWRQDPTRPGAWHRPVGHGPFLASCTSESRSFVRLWLITTRAPYVPGPRRSLLDLCETDSESGRRGSLASYTVAMGRARHYLVSSVSNGLDVHEFRHDSLRPAGTLRSIRDRSAKQRIAAAGLRTAATTAAEIAADLATDLRRLCAADARLDPLTPDQPAIPFAAEDRLQMADALGLVDFNWERVAAVEHQLTAIETHDDNIATGRATRATSMSTVLLAVTAAAVGAAQLSQTYRGRVSLALMAGGALLAVGVLVLDSTTATTRAHLLSMTIAGASVGTGLGLWASWPIPLVVVAAGLGALSGATITLAIEAFTFSARLHTVRRWLLRPVVPNLHPTAGAAAVPGDSERPVQR